MYYQLAAKNIGWEWRLLVLALFASNSKEIHGT